MIFSTLLVSSLLVFGARADDDEEAVVTLTGETFDTFIKENPRVLVEFYAPWCGHCKALAPEFEAAAQAIEANEKITAKLAKVDATEDKDLSSRYGVKGFPTLKFFTGDVDAPSDYSGGRTESTIISWIKTRSMPPVTALSNNDEIEEFKQSARVVLVGFYAKDSDAVKVLEEVAEANRESVAVGHVESSDVTVDGVEYDNLYLFRDFGEPVVKFEGELTAEGLAEFINAERFPLIDAIGPENYKDYVDRGLPLVWISLNEEDLEEHENVITALTPFAVAEKGKLSFTYIDAQKYAQHVQNLGITDTPGMMIATDDNKKFLFSGSLVSEDDLNSFFDGYNSGALEANLKSEEIPEDNTGNVKVIVGKTFGDYIGSDKDVFVEFYAPWCGHCKRLAPEYEQVGDAFAAVDSVVIAKIDSTENDTPEDIRGFPTLIFYPAGKTEGVKYEGDRKAEAIVDYIKENASGDMAAVDKSEL